MESIEIKAPAKINIGLNIISRREDGFHNLETIFYPIFGLYDYISFEKSNHFYFECNNDSIPNDESNLIVKATRLLEKLTDLKFNIKIYLKKNIPSGAGLGGGSSDAAATLVSLNEMFSLGFNYNKLLSIALELGSDVPFFLKPKPSYGQSRGEILQEIKLDIIKPILIINPGIHISTKEAFENIIPNHSDFNLDEILVAWKDMSPKIVELHKNDFEEYAFSKYMVLKDIKNMLYDTGALFAQMSGSGSSIYGIYKTVENAETALSGFPKSYFRFINLPQEIPKV